VSGWGGGKEVRRMAETKEMGEPSSSPAADPSEEVASTPPASHGDAEEDLGSWLISCLQAVY
jgi:hypothetical protein